MGAKLEVNTIADDLQTMDVTPSEFYSGYVTNVKVYNNQPVTQTFFDNSFSECGTCTGSCQICTTSNTNCPYETAGSPLLVSYDFTETGTNWIGNQAATGGTGTDMTIAQDWFAATPYQ